MTKIIQTSRSGCHKRGGSGISSQPIRTIRIAVGTGNKPSRAGKWVAVGCAFLLLTGLPVLLSQMASAPGTVSRAIAVVAFALFNWATGMLHETLTSLCVLVLIPLMRVADFSEAIGGFGEPVIWLIISTFILSHAVEKTGLGHRLALFLLALARGRTRSTLLAVIVTVFLLAFAVPTAAGRAAMVTPLCLGIMGVLKRNSDGRGWRNIASSLGIGVAYTSVVMSFALLPGSVSSVYTAAALERLTGASLSYLQWAILMLPVAVPFLLWLWVELLWLFPPESAEVPGGMLYLVQQRARLGPMRPDELRVLAVLILTVVAWIAESWHRLPVTMVALLGALLSCLPGIGVQRWEEAGKAVQWDVVVLYGTGFAIARVLQDSGAALWLARKVLYAVPKPSPLEAALVVLAALMVIRLGFVNMVALVATLLPVTIELAGEWGLNRIWMAQLTLIGSSVAFFFPTQSPAGVITSGAALYDNRDFLRAGIVAVVILIGVTLPVTLLLWPKLGVSP